MQFRAVKGMNDILPDAVGRWHRLEAAFRRVVESYGFGELRTPVVEPTELFVRSIGEVTDVVQKEMYSFEHHKDRLTLRPELTASAVRAYVQHKVNSKEPVSRWYYIAPMYRAERPQRGRYRQFYQAGCELYGDAGPASDAEMIDMLVSLYTELGIPDLKVCIHSLGGPGSRAKYREALLEYLRPRKDELTELSQERMEKNPLRILDSKSEKDQAVVENAPRILDCLEEEDLAHWDELKRHLDALGMQYEVDPKLVRGLDYYTRTLFEIKSDAGNLGAQNTLVGGGRYDGLVKRLGGADVPAIGFAMGLERILLALPETDDTPSPPCFFAPLGEAAISAALVHAKQLRLAGVRTEVDSRGNSLKSMLRRANGLGVRHCVVIGESELEEGRAQLKDLAKSETVEVKLSALVARLQSLMTSEDEA